jgi:hypothetical protein
MIELTSGRNKFEIGCLNEAGAESLRALSFANYDVQVGGDLYFIGFGVSEYENQDLNLTFAHKDALDLSGTFGRMKGRFNSASVHVFINEQGNVANILKAKELLRGARVDDTLVLFISGHGMHDRDKEATYYFLTHETDLSNLPATAAEFELLEDLLQGIGPRSKLFLMDTCESGEVEDATGTELLSQADSKGLRARTIRDAAGRGEQGIRNLATPKRPYLLEKERYIYNDLVRRSGAIVFSSCRGGELSYESEDVGNGFFTAKVMEAFKNEAADKDGDGVLSTDELREFVCREVAKMTSDENYPEGLQHPTVDRDNIDRKFGFPMVK